MKTNRQLAAEIIKRRAKEATRQIKALEKKKKNRKLAYTRPRTWKAKDPFYTSDLWRDLRYRALKLHGARCQCCGATAKDGVMLHVDHIKPRSKFPEFQLDLSNLQILCEDCNLGKSNIDETDWRISHDL